MTGRLQIRVLLETRILKYRIGRNLFELDYDRSFNGQKLLQDQAHHTFECGGRPFCQTFGLAVGYTTFRLRLWLHNDLSKWRWMFDPHKQNFYQLFGHM